MVRLKKWLCGVSSAALIVTLVAATGCSTPQVAVTLDGREYSTGEYLAYLYNAFQSAYNYAYQNEYYASMLGGTTHADIWDVTIPYGEKDKDGKQDELKLEDYIKQVALDNLIRQKALENKLDEYGIELLKEELEKAEKDLKSIAADDLLKLGISKEHYAAMYKAVQVNEQSLFYGLYDKGGVKAMSEKDIRQYFDDYYMSYKSIEISLVDSSGKALSDAKIKEIKERLKKYEDLYKKNKDFDKVIEKYKEDEEAATATTTTTTTGTGTGTGTGTAGTRTQATTSTTSPTTSTRTPTTTTGKTTTAGTGATGTGTGTTKQATTGTTAKPTEANRHDIDANPELDENKDNESFLKALKTIKENETGIVEYEKDGNKTAALILRLDPEKGVGKETYFEDSRKNILYGAKGKEYNDELDAYIKTLKDRLSVDDRAIKMCSPKNFIKDQNKK